DHQRNLAPAELQANQIRSAAAGPATTAIACQLQRSLCGLVVMRNCPEASRRRTTPTTNPTTAPRTSPGIANGIGLEGSIHSPNKEPTIVQSPVAASATPILTRLNSNQLAVGKATKPTAAVKIAVKGRIAEARGK